jgi:hypothetical protein
VIISPKKVGNLANRGIKCQQTLNSNATLVGSFLDGILT